MSLSGKQILSKYGGKEVVDLWDGLREGLGRYYGSAVAKDVNKGGLYLVEILYRALKKHQSVGYDKLSFLFFDVVDVYECCCERLSTTRCSDGRLS